MKKYIVILLLVATGMVAEAQQRTPPVMVKNKGYRLYLDLSAVKRVSQEGHYEFQLYKMDSVGKLVQSTIAVCRDKSAAKKILKDSRTLNRTLTEIMVFNVLEEGAGDAKTYVITAYEKLNRASLDELRALLRDANTFYTPPPVQSFDEGYTQPQQMQYTQPVQQNAPPVQQSTPARKRSPSNPG